MELSINEVAERAEQFVARVAQARWKPGPHARPVAADEHSDAQRRRDAYVALKESKLTDAPRMLRHLAFVHRIRAAHEGLFDTADALAQPIVSSNEQLPLAEALHRLSEDPERDRRHLLERDAGQALWDRQAPFARVVESYVRANAMLGVDFETFDGPLKPWLDAAETFLLKTEDAYRDLLGYALRRIDPVLKARTARGHDVAHAATAPWMRDLTGIADLVPAAIRTFDDLGLHPARLTIEDRDATEVFAIEVPGDVRIGTRRRPGLAAQRAVLEAFGEASLWSHARADAPVVDRRFVHPVNVATARAIAGAFTLEEGWLQRYLRLPASSSREAARMGAFGMLAHLRRAAAVLPHAVELFTRGPVRGLADEYADRIGKALWVGVPRGFFLLRAADGVDASVLQAASLEVALGEQLRERFNEDYYRNPATGSWFRDWAGKAGVEPLSAAAANLARVGQRLVRLMGA